MSLWVVDVEADGPCPGKFSMVSFGAVRVDNELKTSFYGQIAPISEEWIPEALAVSGHTREETLLFPDQFDVMSKFAAFISEHNIGDRPIFLSDNNGFDWQFINYYFHVYYGSNPFGHSSRRITDIAAGLAGKLSGSGNWRKGRKTKHTHHPVDDAMGNAEAFVTLCNRYKVSIPHLNIIK